MQVPSGYYRSILHPGMIFKRRDCLGAIPIDTSPRRKRHEIDNDVTNETYAAEGKRLTSEDAHRYGQALSSGKLCGYFAWRSSIGLVWWEELETRYPAPSNDNKKSAKKVA